MPSAQAAAPFSDVNVAACDGCLVPGSKPMARRIFPAGNDDKGRSFDDLRWSRFKNFAPTEMFTVVGEHVFPFLRTGLGKGGDGSTYAHHMKDARFTISARACDGENAGTKIHSEVSKVLLHLYRDNPAVPDVLTEEWNHSFWNPGYLLNEANLKFLLDRATDRVLVPN